LNDVVFLEHVILEDGIFVDPRKVKGVFN
jgi:hypothetical protein